MAIITSLLRNLKSSINSSSPSLPIILQRYSILRSFTTSIPKVNTKVNFIPPNSSDSDTEPEPEPETTQKKPVDLPPPYDPFNDKPVIQKPEDPKNLQQVFHNMRTEGLMSYAAKMFDEMSKDGLTHEALELFREMKDNDQMPDVVAHTAVIEAYANAGQFKEAYKVYRRMLACGVAPNAYTYAVLIKSLSSSGDGKMFGEARKCVLEMLGKGMGINAATCVAVFEGFVMEGKVEEGKELLEEMEGKGFVVDDEGVNEVLGGKRGTHVRTVRDLLFKKH